VRSCRSSSLSGLAIQFENPRAAAADGSSADDASDITRSLVPASARVALHFARKNDAVHIGQVHVQDDDRVGPSRTVLALEKIQGRFPKNRFARHRQDRGAAPGPSGAGFHSHRPPARARAAQEGETP